MPVILSSSRQKYPSYYLRKSFNTQYNTPKTLFGQVGTCAFPPLLNNNFTRRLKSCFQGKCVAGTTFQTYLLGGVISEVHSQWSFSRHQNHKQEEAAGQSHRTLWWTTMIDSFTSRVTEPCLSSKQSNSSTKALGHKLFLLMSPHCIYS